MAILTGGLLGTARQGIGGIVTYVLNGQQIARSKPSSYKDAKTDTQKKQRTAMTVMLALARLALGAIRTSFSNRDIKRSGVNEFLSKNLKNGAYDKATSQIVPSKLKFASGPKLKLQIAGIVWDEATGNATMTIVPNANGTTGLVTDTVKVVVYDQATDNVYTLTSAGTRADGVHIFNTPFDAAPGNRNVNIYAYAASPPECSNCGVSEDEWNEMELIFA